MWAVKPVRKSVTLNPWGMYAAGKKEKINEQRGRKAFRLQSQNRVEYGGPLRAGTVKQEEKRSSGNGGLGSQIGVGSMGP